MSPLPPSPRWSGDNAKPQRWVVFYNIYTGLPETINIEDRQLLQRYNYDILEDQIRQLGTSYAASSGELNIYYNSIGAEIDALWIQKLCSTQHYNMSCSLIQHYHTGFEDKTLSDIKQYCSDHPDNSVIYLHNKGALHLRKRTQTNWRRSMTAAVSSKMCLEPLDQKQQLNLLVDFNQERCNVCGLLFQPLPGPHFPGNMWSAKCSYINKLLIPNEYHVKRQRIHDWIKVEQSKGSFAANLFVMEAHYTGDDRYEAEHWIGSHPTLIPCDVSQTPNLKYWHVDRKTKYLKRLIPKDYTNEFQFSLAPRHSINKDWFWYSYAQRTDFLSHDNKQESYTSSSGSELVSKDLRMLDFFLLRGMLARWHLVYSQLPKSTTSDRNNWIWSWYPDGEEWRQGVERYGPAAIHELVKDIKLPNMINSTIFRVELINETNTG